MGDFACGMGGLWRVFHVVPMLWLKGFGSPDPVQLRLGFLWDGEVFERQLACTD